MTDVPAIFEDHATAYEARTVLGGDARYVEGDRADSLPPGLFKDHRFAVLAIRRPSAR
ncbi:MAG TPA: hypothetical protein VGF63_10865 [Solirubrobacteraceae bacterium]|jgi:hypothetical protein